MALRAKQVDSYYRTVRTIASSWYVQTFHIGHTYRAGIARFTDYKRFEFDHLVILADKLTQDDARGLEEELQKKCREDKREVTWRKYHPHKRKAHQEIEWMNLMGNVA